MAVRERHHPHAPGAVARRVAQPPADGHRPPAARRRRPRPAPRRRGVAGPVTGSTACRCARRPTATCSRSAWTSTARHDRPTLSRAVRSCGWSWTRSPCSRLPATVPPPSPPSPRTSRSGPASPTPSDHYRWARPTSATSPPIPTTREARPSCWVPAELGSSGRARPADAAFHRHQIRRDAGSLVRLTESESAELDGVPRHQPRRE
jgi:hypothetical protein